MAISPLGLNGYAFAAQQMGRLNANPAVCSDDSAAASTGWGSTDTVSLSADALEYAANDAAGSHGPSDIDEGASASGAKVGIGPNHVGDGTDSKVGDGTSHGGDATGAKTAGGPTRPGESTGSDAKLNWETIGWIAGGVAVGALCLPLAGLAGLGAGAAFAIEGALATGSLTQ